ncbi:hypothetical protein [Terrisporobacter mayombei]|uniref:hypothetical protein n=1 Tax=Terrisporobacter mayombei TaxID=1541 RepID=UPI0026597878|nr:hypothetical protein [Terrisporobacter mayombei]MCC3668897.1 hypothetical protein [Terrisporobacter mayombei]
MSKKKRKRKIVDSEKYDNSKKEEYIQNKLNEKSDNECKQDLEKEEMSYSKIISKLTNKREYLNLFHKYVFDKMSLLDFMDETEDMIENSKISNEELNKLNSILKYKFLNERYTVDKIIKEENTITYNPSSTQIRCRKPTKHKKLNKKNTFKDNVSLYYLAEYEGKKIIPKDLRKYDKMRAVRSIIYNAVGTKR